LRIARDRRLHRGDDPRVGSAPADVALEMAGDVVVAGVRVRAQQRGGADDHPRRAEPALERLCLEERLLHRVEATIPRQALDRRHLFAGGVGDAHPAGQDRPIAQAHGARAALPFAAAVLGAGEVQPIPQHREQGLVAWRVDPPLLAVHDKLELRDCNLLRAREFRQEPRRSPPPLRREPTNRRDPAESRRSSGA
jgi:hypothetical protein